MAVAGGRKRAGLVIALVGQSVVDRVFWPDGLVEHRLGGAPVFAANAVAGSWPALVVTQGGNDDLLRPLRRCGLEVVAGPPRDTTVFEVLLRGDGTWSESIVALGDPFTCRDVETWMAGPLARCSAVVCGAQWRDDFPPDVLAALRRGGRRVYLDGQGPARPRRLGPIRLEGPLDPRAVRSVDVLKLGEEEALALIGGIDPAAALATGVPVVVVTLGERGAVVLAEGRATEIGVDPVLGLADTVGAGDSFLALMAAAVDAGADPLEAARSACAAVARLLRARLVTEPAPTPVPAALSDR
jgi:sugar/nucleoside kinase (ribokinase family)